jgi:hypothetical protein
MKKIIVYINDLATESEFDDLVQSLDENHITGAVITNTDNDPIIPDPGLEAICRESKEIIEGFHKLLGVDSSTEALGKIAVLMREDDTADRLLSKALGHLQTCPEPGSTLLYQEIAEAFGIVEQLGIKAYPLRYSIAISDDDALLVVHHYDKDGQEIGLQNVVPPTSAAASALRPAENHKDVSFPIAVSGNEQPSHLVKPKTGNERYNILVPSVIKTIPFDKSNIPPEEHERYPNERKIELGEIELNNVTRDIVSAIMLLCEAHNIPMVVFGSEYPTHVGSDVCPFCKGEKALVCPACNGLAPGACARCHGVGVIACPKCAQ